MNASHDRPSVTLAEQLADEACDRHEAEALAELHALAARGPWTPSSPPASFEPADDAWPPVPDVDHLLAAVDDARALAKRRRTFVAGLPADVAARVDVAPLLSALDRIHAMRRAELGA